MPPRRKFAVVSATDSRRLNDLRDAVATAQADMTWLKPSDEALKALAIRMAEEIETTVDRAEELDALYRDTRGEPGGTEIYKRLAALEAACDVAKVIALVGPQLQAVLRDLGGTPAAREKIDGDKPVANRLDRMREAAGKKV